MNEIERIYLLMENGYRKEEYDRITISGFLKGNKVDKTTGLRGFWCRLCYFHKTNQLVITNTRSGEIIVKQL